MEHDAAVRARDEGISERGGGGGEANENGLDEIDENDAIIDFGDDAGEEVGKGAEEC